MVETQPDAGPLRVEIRDQPILLVMAALAEADEIAARLGLLEAQAVRREGIDRVAIAPGKWLLLGGDEGGELVSRLGRQVSILEMDSAYVRLSLAGPGWRRLLETGVALDVARLAPGDAAVTAVAGINLVLWLIEPDRVELAVTRSYYRSFLDWLKEAAGPDGLDAT